jgi:hypothetical protein
MRQTHLHISAALPPHASDDGSIPEPSNENVVQALPLLAICALVYQGFDRSNLPPSSAQPFFSAAGRPIFLDTVTRRALSALYLTFDRSLARLNEVFWPVINDLINLTVLTVLTQFPGLSPIFPAAHAFLRLLFLLSTKTFHLNREMQQTIAIVRISPLKARP